MTDDDPDPIKDNRGAATKNLDQLSHEVRQIDGVRHATSNSAGNSDWLSVILDADWDGDQCVESYPIPDEVLGLTVRNRWTLVGIYAEYQKSTERYEPVCTFRPMEWVVSNFREEESMTRKKPVIQEVQGRVDGVGVLLFQGTKIVFGFGESEYHGRQEIYISEDDEDPFAVNEFSLPQNKRPKYQLDAIHAEEEAFKDAYRAIQSMEELSRRIPEVAEAIQQAEDY